MTFANELKQLTIGYKYRCLYCCHCNKLLRKILKNNTHLYQSTLMQDHTDTHAKIHTKQYKYIYKSHSSGKTNQPFNVLSGGNQQYIETNNQLDISERTSQQTIRIFFALGFILGMPT